MFISHLYNFKTKFLVFKFNTFVSAKLLFNSKLFFAFRIKTDEAGWEKDSVLHILFDLESDWVANQTFLLRVCDLNTTKTKL